MQGCPRVSECMQVCPRVSKCVQACPCVSKCMQVCPRVSECWQACLSVFPYVPRFVLVCPSSDACNSGQSVSEVSNVREGPRRKTLKSPKESSKESANECSSFNPVLWN